MANVPLGIPIHNGDYLNLGVQTSDAGHDIGFGFTVLDAAGNPLKLPLTATVTGTTRAGTAKKIPIVNDGYIVSGSVSNLDSSASTIPTQPGQLFVQAQLYAQDQKTVIASLIRGYLYDGHVPAFPGPLEYSQDGRGRIYNVAPSSPAAGAEISVTVPTNAVWRVFAFEFKLVTSSTVNNRTHHILIHDGTAANVIFQGNGESPTQAASTTRNFIYKPWYGVALETSFDASNFIRLPLGLGSIELLQAGGIIKTVSTLLDAADQYTINQLWVEEWLT